MTAGMNQEGVLNIMSASALYSTGNRICSSGYDGNKSVSEKQKRVNFKKIKKAFCRGPSEGFCIPFPSMLRRAAQLHLQKGPGFAVDKVLCKTF